MYCVSVGALGEGKMEHSTSEVIFQWILKEEWVYDTLRGEHSGKKQQEGMFGKVLLIPC